MLRLVMGAAPVLALVACISEDPPISSADGAGKLDGFYKWDLNTGKDWWSQPKDTGPAQESGGDGPAPTTATVITPVEVKGSACKGGWQDTGSKVSGTSCQVHLGSVRLGAGDGPEPDRYGCRLDSAGSGVWAYLFELDCDDKGKIGLSCAGSCGGKGVTRGSVEVTGLVGCKDGWRGTGKNLGAGKTCAAFVAYAQLGVGSGAEPDAIGCRYNASTGEVETYLYELGCDDKAKIAIRCEWICSAATVASAGKVGTTVSSQCSQMWTAAGSKLGVGKTCVAGMEYLKLGVGSGAEPDLFGCRFDATSGQLEALLREVSCDDKAVKLDCGYLCFN